MNYLLILLLVSLAVSALGWIYFIYFFSIGYGFAISALSVASVIIFRDVITLPIAILAAVLFYVFGEPVPENFILLAQHLVQLQLMGGPASADADGGNAKTCAAHKIERQKSLDFFKSVCKKSINHNFVSLY